jgi:hypothetical protein
VNVLPFEEADLLLLLKTPCCNRSEADFGAALVVAAFAYEGADAYGGKKGTLAVKREDSLKGELP